MGADRPEEGNRPYRQAGIRLSPILIPFNFNKIEMEEQVQELRLVVVRHEEQIKSLFRIATGIQDSLEKIAKNGESRAGDRVRIDQHAAQIQELSSRLEVMRTGFEQHFKELSRQISSLEQHRAGITGRQAVIGAIALVVLQFVLALVAGNLT